MLGRTHFMAGAALGTTVGTLIGNPVAGLITGGIAALIPDIDEPNSLIGRKLPILAWPIKLIFGHRTITHTIEFSIALSVLGIAIATTWLSYPQNIYLGIYMLVGLLSHLLLDALTKSGVALFACKPEIHPSGPFRTGSILEGLWILGFGFIIVYFLA